MAKKLLKKARAAVPKVTKAAKNVAKKAAKAVGGAAKSAAKAVGGAAKSAAKAVGGAAKSAGKAAVKTAKKIGNAAKNSKAGKMVSKAVAAVPAAINKIGKTASKVKAAIPKYVNAAKQRVGQTVTAVRKKATQLATAATKRVSQATSAVKNAAMDAMTAVGEAVQGAADYVQGAFADISARNRNIGTRIREEFDQYYQEVKRGITQKGISYVLLSGGGDSLDLLLQMRKAVVEEYPVLTWAERQLQGLHQSVRNGIIEGGDKFGNFVYNGNIPVISDLVGGMFHASDMEGKDATVSSTVGAFINGALGTGLLGTVDGVAGMVADPFGAVEGINDVLRRPEESLPAIYEGVKGYINTNVIHGTAESRSRCAGAVTFEVVAALATTGGSSAAKAAKAGDKAGDMGRMAKVTDRIGDVGKTAKAAVTGKVGKILSSPKTGKLANYADDVMNGFHNMFRPSEPQLSLAMGSLDDIGDSRYFSKLYDDLLEKQALKQSSSGVKISKAADQADDIADAGKVAGGGGSKTFVDNPFDDTGKLKPNIEYKAGEYNYNYQTDGGGRITNWKTDNLQLTEREARLPHNPNSPGKITGDQAGHLAGDRFGGSPELDNIVSQSKDVNLSSYKKIENQWAKAIKEDKKVTVNVDIKYDDSGLRPIEFNVEYTIDGKYYSKDIMN